MFFLGLFREKKYYILMKQKKLYERKKITDPVYYHRAPSHEMTGRSTIVLLNRYFFALI